MYEMKCDVAIIGGGPAGLSRPWRLRRKALEMY